MYRSHQAEMNENARLKRSLFSGKRNATNRKPRLPTENIWQIFDYLSFEEAQPFGDELYWKRRCEKDFGVLVKIGHKSWRMTYKTHDTIHRRFEKLLEKIFRSFTKYKGGFYERDPSIRKDWKNYIRIRDNGKLRKICSLASFQTKFVNKYCEMCLTKIFKTYPYYVGMDYSEEPADNLVALCLALSPLLRQGNCLTKASDFIKLSWDPDSVDLIEEWASENEDMVMEYLPWFRALYQILEDKITIDIPGPFPKPNQFRKGGLLAAHQQFWAFITHPEYPVDR